MKNYFEADPIIVKDDVSHNVIYDHYMYHIQHIQDAMLLRVNINKIGSDVNLCSFWKYTNDKSLTIRVILLSNNIDEVYDDQINIIYSNSSLVVPHCTLILNEPYLVLHKYEDKSHDNVNEFIIDVLNKRFLTLYNYSYFRFTPNSILFMNKHDSSIAMYDVADGSFWTVDPKLFDDLYYDTYNLAQGFYCVYTCDREFSSDPKNRRLYWLHERNYMIVDYNKINNSREFNKGSKLIMDNRVRSDFRWEYLNGDTIYINNG